MCVEKSVSMVLKSLTGYDEQQMMRPVEQRCRHLYDEMEGDDLITKLIKYGMNARFDGLTKNIKVLAKLRKRVYKYGKIAPAFFIELWLSRYREIRSASKAYLKYADNGFKDAAAQCARETLVALVKIKESGSDIIPDALIDVLPRAEEELSELGILISDVLDSSSNAAKGYFIAIRRALLKWRLKSVLEAIEQGKIFDEDDFFAPIHEAIRVAKSWAGMKLGVTAQNPRAIHSARTVEVVMKDRLYSITASTTFTKHTDADINALRAELGQIKEENDIAIKEASSLINSALAACLKQKRIRKDIVEREEALLRTLGNRERFVCCDIAAGNADYFVMRIENERNFSEYINSFIPVARQLSIAHSAQKTDYKAVGTLLSGLEERGSLWINNKNKKWKENLTMTILKTQLISMVDATIEDVKLFGARSRSVDDAPTKAENLATSMAKRLAKSRAAIENLEFVDSEECYRVLAEAREKLAAARNFIPKADSIRTGDAIDEFDALVIEAAAITDPGRRLKARHNIDNFARENKELIALGEVDELTAAAYVLKRVNVNAAFFAERRAKMIEDLDKLETGNLEDDDYYLALVRNTTLAADRVKKAKAEGKPNSYVNSLYDLFKDCKGAVDAYRAKKIESMKAEAAKLKRKLHYMTITDRFAKVAEIFSGDSEASYTLRARIMVRNNVEYFVDMFEEYIDAATVGDIDRMNAITDKLDDMERGYNQNDSVEMKMRDDELTERYRLANKTEISYEDREEPKYEEEPLRNMDDLDEYATIVSEPEIKVNEQLTADEAELEKWSDKN